MLPTSPELSASIWPDAPEKCKYRHIKILSLLLWSCCFGYRKSTWPVKKPALTIPKSSLLVDEATPDMQQGRGYIFANVLQMLYFTCNHGLTPVKQKSKVIVIVRSHTKKWEPTKSLFVCFHFRFRHPIIKTIFSHVHTIVRFGSLALSQQLQHPSVFTGRQR